MPTEVTSADVARLSRAAKSRAYRAIENIHIAYYEKGGVRDLEDKLNEQRGAAAKHIYALAVYASENAKNHAEAVTLFLSMCAYAEARYKEEHDVQNLKDVLPTWAVYKSNILRGVKVHRLDPAEYRSEGAFRVAMQKIEAPKALPPPANLREAVKEVSELLSRTGVSDTLQTLLTQIIFECEILKPGHQKAAAGILRETMNKLQPFVDERKAE